MKLINKLKKGVRVWFFTKALSELEEVAGQAKAWGPNINLLCAFTRLLNEVSEYAVVDKHNRMTIVTSFKTFDELFNWLDQGIDYVTPSDTGLNKQVPSEHTNVCRETMEVSLNTFFTDKNGRQLNVFEILPLLYVRLKDIQQRFNDLPSAKEPYYSLRFKDGFRQIFTLLESISMVIVYDQTYRYIQLP